MTKKQKKMNNQQNNHVDPSSSSSNNNNNNNSNATAAAAAASSSAPHQPQVNNQTNNVKLENTNVDGPVLVGVSGAIDLRKYTQNVINYNGNRPVVEQTISAWLREFCEQHHLAESFMQLLANFGISDEKSMMSPSVTLADIKQTCHPLDYQVLRPLFENAVRGGVLTSLKTTLSSYYDGEFKEKDIVASSSNSSSGEGGGGNKTEEVVGSVSDLFVSLRIKTEERKKSSSSGDNNNDGDDGEQINKHHGKDVEDVMNNEGQHRSGEDLPAIAADNTTLSKIVLISGAAGSGKTHLCKMLCVQQKFPEAILVFVSLRDLLDANCRIRKLRDLLQFAISGPVSESNIEKIVSLEIPIIFILDGFDEVQFSEPKSPIGNFLHEFVDPERREYYLNPDNNASHDLVRPCDIVIISSREERGTNSNCNLDNPAVKKQHWILLPWCNFEIKMFTSKWFTARLHNDTAELIHPYQQQVFRLPTAENRTNNSTSTSPQDSTANLLGSVPFGDNSNDILTKNTPSSPSRKYSQGGLQSDSENSEDDENSKLFTTPKNKKQQQGNNTSTDVDNGSSSETDNNSSGASGSDVESPAGSPSSVTFPPTKKGDVTSTACSSILHVFTENNMEHFSGLPLFVRHLCTIVYEEILAAARSILSSPTKTSLESSSSSSGILTQQSSVSSLDEQEPLSPSRILERVIQLAWLRDIERINKKLKSFSPSEKKNYNLNLEENQQADDALFLRVLQEVSLSAFNQMTDESHNNFTLIDIGANKPLWSVLFNETMVLDIKQNRNSITGDVKVTATFPHRSSIEYLCALYASENPNNALVAGGSKCIIEWKQRFVTVILILADIAVRNSKTKTSSSSSSSSSASSSEKKKLKFNKDSIVDYIAALHHRSWSKFSELPKTEQTPERGAEIVLSILTLRLTMILDCQKLLSSITGSHGFFFRWFGDMKHLNYLVLYSGRVGALQALEWVEKYDKYYADRDSLMYSLAYALDHQESPVISKFVAELSSRQPPVTISLEHTVKIGSIVGTTIAAFRGQHEFDAKVWTKLLKIAFTKQFFDVAAALLMYGKWNSLQNSLLLASILLECDIDKFPFYDEDVIATTIGVVGNDDEITVSEIASKIKSCMVGMLPSKIKTWDIKTLQRSQNSKSGGGVWSWVPQMSSVTSSSSPSSSSAAAASSSKEKNNNKNNNQKQNQEQEEPSFTRAISTDSVSSLFNKDSRSLVSEALNVKHHDRRARIYKENPELRIRLFGKLCGIVKKKETFVWCSKFLNDFRKQEDEEFEVEMQKLKAKQKRDEHKEQELTRSKQQVDIAILDALSALLTSVNKNISQWKNIGLDSTRDALVSFTTGGASSSSKLIAGNAELTTKWCLVVVAVAKLGNPINLFGSDKNRDILVEISPWKNKNTSSSSSSWSSSSYSSKTASAFLSCLASITEIDKEHFIKQSDIRSAIIHAVSLIDDDEGASFVGNCFKNMCVMQDNMKFYGTSEIVTDCLLPTAKLITSKTSAESWIFAVCLLSTPPESHKLFRSVLIRDALVKTALLSSSDEAAGQVGSILRNICEGDGDDNNVATKLLFCTDEMCDALVFVNRGLSSSDAAGNWMCALLLFTEVDEAKLIIGKTEGICDAIARLVVNIKSVADAKNYGQLLFFLTLPKESRLVFGKTSIIQSIINLHQYLCSSSPAMEENLKALANLADCESEEVKKNFPMSSFCSFLSALAYDRVKTDTCAEKITQILSLTSSTELGKSVYGSNANLRNSLMTMLTKFKTPNIATVFFSYLNNVTELSSAKIYGEETVRDVCITLAAHITGISTMEHFLSALYQIVSSKQEGQLEKFAKPNFLRDCLSSSSVLKNVSSSIACDRYCRVVCFLSRTANFANFECNSSLRKAFADVASSACSSAAADSWCDAINRVAECNDDNKKYLGADPSIRDAFSSVSKYVSSQIVGKLNFFSAISLLAGASDSNRKNFGDAKLVEAMVTVAVDQFDNSSAIEQFCRAVVSVVDHDNDENTKLLGENINLRHVIEGVAKHISTNDCAFWYAKALKKLFRLSDNRKILCTSELRDSMITVSNASSSFPSFFEEFVLALSLATEGTHESRRVFACREIRDTLCSKKFYTLCSASSDVAAEAFYVSLLNLTTASDAVTLQNVFSQSSILCDALVSVSNNIKTGNAAKAFCGTVYNLVFNNSNARKLYGVQSVATAFSIISPYIRDDDAANSFFSAIYEITSYNNMNSKTPVFDNECFAAALGRVSQQISSRGSTSSLLYCLNSVLSGFKLSSSYQNKKHFGMDENLRSVFLQQNGKFISFVGNSSALASLYCKAVESLILTNDEIRDKWSCEELRVNINIAAKALVKDKDGAISFCRVISNSMAKSKFRPKLWLYDGLRDAMINVAEQIVSSSSSASASVSSSSSSSASVVEAVDCWCEAASDLTSIDDWNQKKFGTVEMRDAFLLLGNIISTFHGLKKFCSAITDIVCRSGYNNELYATESMRDIFIKLSKVAKSCHSVSDYFYALAAVNRCAAARKCFGTEELRNSVMIPLTANVNSTNSCISYCKCLHHLVELESNIKIFGTSEIAVALLKMAEMCKSHGEAMKQWSFAVLSLVKDADVAQTFRLTNMRYKCKELLEDFGGKRYQQFMESAEAKEAERHVKEIVKILESDKK